MAISDSPTPHGSPRQAVGDADVDLSSDSDSDNMPDVSQLIQERGRPQSSPPSLRSARWTRPRTTKRSRASLEPPPATQPIPSTPPTKTLSSSNTPRSGAKNKAAQRIGTVLRKRSATFWHLDGSVVVQVQNTLFRLHRSRLSQHSEFFAALFRNSGGRCVTVVDIDDDPESASSGRPPDRDSPTLVENDTVDSCPVYIIDGVSVLDFDRLLTALDAGIAYAINPPSFNVLASLVRAAHAPSFKSIVTFATHLLHQMWPNDLAKLPSPKERDAAAATQTILLAQDFGQDLSVYVHAESSGTSDSAGRLKMETDEDEKDGPAPVLPASDFVRLAHAKQVLQHEWLALARAPPLPSAFVCPLGQMLAHTKQPDPVTYNAMRLCQRARLAEETQWHAWLVPSGLFELGMVDVFEGMRSLIDMDWKEKGFCIGCVSERRDVWSAKRQRLWDQLDVLLGLKDADAL